MMTDYLLYAAAAVGAAYVGQLGLSLLVTLLNAYVVGGASLKKYGAGDPEAWAIVTGASEGIGREFALQLAAAKLNVVVLARTESKLKSLAEEIEAKHGVKAMVLPFNFTTTSKADYDRLAGKLEPLKIAVLVNNVGMNHDIPTPFLEETQERIDDIVQVNVRAQMAVTRMILPKMVAAKKGLVLNIGSVAGTVPSGLLSVYSASKAFLRYWSQALAMEVKKSGVHVEHVTTYFVVTAMSKIRKPSFTTPTPRQYVRSVLSRTGKFIDSAPFPSHGLLMWIMNNFTTETMRIQYSNNLHVDIRKRALKKRAREAKQQ
ncbi:hypothetical protein HK101_009149 [Irineochytrium annulatum]|nr:hypothetical protein HK101_009149 [Irineochytrium annulatum]